MERVMSLSHSKTPLSELNSEDKRTVLKSADSRGKTSSGIVPDNTVGSSENPYVRSRTYLAAQPTQETNISLHLGSELPGFVCSCNEYSGHSSAGKISEASVSVISAPPLLVQCDDCHGAGRVTNDHPNDPWAKAWTCSMCDGTGEVIPECNGWKCREDATEWVDGATWCPVHAAEQKADAEAVA
jgi:DnaJ-class molecular chaperone